MRPGSTATSPALTRCSTASASRPCTRSLPNEEVSNMPAASRTARCSAAECSNQFCRPNEYSYSRLTPARGVPVGPLPAQQLAEDRPGRRHPVVQRAAAQPADAGALLVGPVDLVGEVQGLGDALLEEAPVGLVRRGPAGVGLGQVERRAPVHDPVRQDRAGPGAGQEADRVEAGGDEEVAHPGRLAEVVQAVRGEALRPAEMQPDADLGQHRQPLHHVLVERPEVVPVLRQPGELRVDGDAARGPRVAARLEEADHEPGALVLHVRVVGGGLDRRQAGRQAGDRPR